MEAAVEIIEALVEAAPTVRESIDYGTSAYQAVQTGRAIRDQINALMPKRRKDGAADIARKRIKAALHGVTGGLIGPMTAAQAGYVRTAGNYGRYNNPENRTAENKFFDTAQSFDFDATGEVPATGQLSLIPQGTDGNKRIGRKTTIHSIQIRGFLELDPSAGSAGAQVCWMMLVQDKQCNGAAAAVTDVLDSTDLGVGMINMSNSTRFKILRRWNMVLKSHGGVDGAQFRDKMAFEYFKKCNIPVEFSSTTGAITEIRSNNIFLIAGCDSGGGSDLVKFLGNVRLRFSD